MKKLLAAVTVLAVSTAQADTIYVDANCPGGDGSELDPYCSIQTAIDNAVDTDEIVVAPGTYFEAINFLGKTITLRSLDGPDVTTIDAQQSGTVVTCVSGEGLDTVLRGFTIRGGIGTEFDGSPLTRGGGMLNEESSPTVIDCRFVANTADFGGGMYNEESSAAVIGCLFFNYVELSGGGIYTQGGAITVLDSTFQNNLALHGAGLHAVFATITISNCLFASNASNSDGGAVSIAGGSQMFTGCVFFGNGAIGDGGAIRSFANAITTVTDCLFDENFASDDGGGIFNDAAATVTNSTFVRNMADSGGGMHTRSADSTSVVNNCVFWYNYADVTGEAQISNSLGAETFVSYSNVQDGYSGSGNIAVNTLFVDFNDRDYRLAPGSPSIDAGDNTAVPKGTMTDLDGNPRFVDDPDTIDSGNGDPPVVDMGAYEFQGTSCPWDCDGGESIDGTVGITDFLLLLAQWGSPGSCDFDGGGVGINDFLDLLANWGPCP